MTSGSLAKQVANPKYWPTPDAAAGTGYNQTDSPNAKKRPLLGAAVKMWPTPNSRDWKNATAAEWEDKKNTRNLNRKMASDFKGSQVKEERLGQLNPMWVEWLMGYPSGWTDLEHSETP